MVARCRSKRLIPFSTINWILGNMDDDGSLSSIATINDETSNGNISVRLSAIHALMAISEPMCYNDLHFPLLDENNRIASQEISQIDDQYNFHPSFDRRSHHDLMSRDRAINDASTTSLCNADTNTNTSLGYKYADSMDQNQRLQVKTQSFDSFKMRGDRSDTISTLISTESHTGLRKCRYEGCVEKIILITQEVSLGSREDDDDRIYHHSLYCKKHLLGSRKCEHEGCDKCAQGSTKFCIKHGG